MASTFDLGGGPRSKKNLVSDCPGGGGCTVTLSGPWTNRSTESALLKVHNDIKIRMDKGVVTDLTLLDLSAAFDTIDHATLTDWLVWNIWPGSNLAFFLFAK